ncbi:MAG: hypothetical protein J6Y91_01580, partial [Alphaproteobacteria bacterium]|nr:hypothetical protein [Alphaproteobacteria bacterium]
RSYYMQEMKRRIYETFGRGSIYKKNNTKTNTNSTTSKVKNEQKNSYNFVKKPPLNDLILRNMVAGMITYPELIGRYEEKITAFEINDSVMAKILAEIIEINQTDEHLDSDILLEKLKLNFAEAIGGLWEVNMYKMQKTGMLDVRGELDKCLYEIQLKQLDADIKECVKIMNEQQSNSSDIYERYKQLTKERDLILAQNN